MRNKRNGGNKKVSSKDILFVTATLSMLREFLALIKAIIDYMN